MVLKQKNTLKYFNGQDLGKLTPEQSEGMRITMLTGEVLSEG
jgi:hypothetical protein